MASCRTGRAMSAPRTAQALQLGAYECVTSSIQPNACDRAAVPFALRPRDHWYISRGRGSALASKEVSNVVAPGNLARRHRAGRDHAGRRGGRACCRGRPAGCRPGRLRAIRSDRSAMSARAGGKTRRWSRRLMRSWATCTRSGWAARGSGLPGRPTAGGPETPRSTCQEQARTRTLGIQR